MYDIQTLFPVVFNVDTVVKRVYVINDEIIKFSQRSRNKSSQEKSLNNTKQNYVLLFFF